MSQILKAFTGVFLILFMMLVASGIMITYLGVIEAENTHTSILTELEDSAFGREVMISSFREAAQRNYRLEMVVYGEDGAITTCREISEIPADTTQVKKVRVILRYQVLNFGGQEGVGHRFTGYARG